MAGIQINTANPVEANRLVPFALGFRPFFLLAGLSAVLLMLNWVMGFISGVSVSTQYPGTAWHAHEMIYGYTTAVIAGFLLTSVRNWTGMQTATGGWLAALALLWLAGRILPLFPGISNMWLAVVDLAFLPALALAIAIPIVRARQWRNLFLVPMLLLLAAGNLLFHLGVMARMAFGVEYAEHVGFGVIILLIVIIAGRVVGFFMQRGLHNADVKQWYWADTLAIGGTLAYVVLQFFLQGMPLAIIAALAAIGHLARLIGWYQHAMWKVPLLWVLYVGYTWVFIGFILLGLETLHWVNESLAVHSLTAGAIGTMTLGMMARVSLGHTGREMKSHWSLDLAFVLITAAALVRVFLPMLYPVLLLSAIKWSGVLWALAFTLFVIVYAPKLLKARIDGMPG
ncbi:MAG: NnrS family protein [Gammaproteobacteria bacterium]|nr:NnrS family protein [Gammaproteobacteria bacterium]